MWKFRVELYLPISILFPIGVFFRHHITIQHASLRVVYILFTRVILPHISHAYSQTEKHREIANTRGVWGCTTPF